MTPSTGMRIRFSNREDGSFAPESIKVNRNRSASRIPKHLSQADRAAMKTLKTARMSSNRLGKRLHVKSRCL